MIILSPVFYKELGQLAVGRRATVLKAILLALLFIYFVSVAAGLFGHRASYRLNAGEFGRNLFVGLVVIELAAMALFTPVVTAGVVCGEKEADTLGLLFLTRLRSRHIVQDKGLSRLVFMLQTAIITAPFMFAALLFGGVERAQIVCAAGNILAMLFVTGGISMLCSALLRKVGAAVAAAYAAIFVYLLPFPVVVGVTTKSDITMACISPFMSAMMTLEPYTIRRQPMLLYSWVVNLAFGVLLYLIAVGTASLLLRRVAFAEARDRAGDGRRRSLIRRMLSFGLRISPASLFHRSVEIGNNPIAWKESNLRSDYLKVVLYRIVFGLVVVYGIVMALAAFEAHGLHDREVHLVGHACAFFILTILLAVMAASSFSRERDSGTLDILMTTRLRGRAIVMGTFRGLWRSAAPFVVTLLGVLLFGALCTWNLSNSPPIVRSFGPPLWQWLKEWDTKVALWPAVLNIGVFFSAIIVLGMYMSLTRRTTGRAIGWALGVLLSLLVILPTLSGLAYAADADSLGNVLMAASPVYWVADAPNTRSNSFESEFGGNIGYCITIAGYSAVTILTLIRLSRKFDSYAGRQESGPRPRKA